MTLFTRSGVHWIVGLVRASETVRGSDSRTSLAMVASEGCSTESAMVTALRGSGKW